MNEALLNQIAELLGITSTELAETSLEDIEGLLAASFDEAAAADVIELERLTSITEAIESVRAEAVAAETAEAERLAAVEELRNRVSTPKAETPAEELPAEDEPVPEAEEVVEDEDEPVAVAASAPRVAIPRKRPASHAPVATPAPSSQLNGLVAAMDIAGFSAGATIPTWTDLGRAFAEKASSLRPGQNGKVAFTKWTYPEERSLTATAGENSRRLNDIINPTALVAAGGLCGPVTPSYEQEILSTNARPVRDSLPRFGADRGGVVHVAPPVLTDLASGVDIITEAEDAADATKPCVTITCGETETVVISAITACVQVGNFDRRTFPEHFAAWWDLASAQHAREAEGYLLDQIAAGSTNVSDGSNQGGARDTLEALIRARATFISRHRMSPMSTFRVGMPFWMRDLMRADLIREAPGAPQDRLAATDATIEAMFRAAGYSPYYYLDTATGEGEVYGSQGAGALLGWQTAPKLYIYPEGTWVWLDGGTLDFGVEIRDSTLNASNNVRAMFETFENVVKMGPESLELELALCVTGTAGGLVDLACPQVS